MSGAFLHWFDYLVSNSSKAQQEESVMVKVASSSKSIFGFASIEHFFASALGDLQKASLFLDRVGAEAASNAGTVETITSLVPGIGSQAVLLERAAFSALGLVVAAVHSTSTAASASGLNVSLDEATVIAFQDLIAGCRNDMEKLGYKL